MRHERVQQRLDRGARHHRVELAAREVRDHLLIAHCVTLRKRENVAESKPGEPAPNDVARSLPEPLTTAHGLAAGVIDLAV